jgi:hypothetical protein
MAGPRLEPWELGTGDWGLVTGVWQHGVHPRSLAEECRATERLTIRDDDEGSAEHGCHCAHVVVRADSLGPTLETKHKRHIEDMPLVALVSMWCKLYVWGATRREDDMEDKFVARALALLLLAPARPLRPRWPLAVAL